jgi:transmembrane sensor
MTTQDERERARTEDWDLLGSIETHPTLRDWLREIDRNGSHRRQIGRRGALALAASVLVVVGAGTAAYLHFAAPHYETHVGEQRDVILTDGSRITLNTNTSLTVRYSKARRYIELQRGEALFSVKHDTRLPFDVSAGETLTRALGTQFNVDLRNSNVTVSVLEGAVQVTAANNLSAAPVGSSNSTAADAQPGMAIIAPALSKGEAVEVRPQEHRVVTEKADSRRIDAWRTRRLEFSDTPLVEAVAEFNRYSSTRVVIGTPELESVRVSGAFGIGDADGFLFSMKEALHVRTLDSPGEVTLVRGSLPSQSYRTESQLRPPVQSSKRSADEH